VNRSASYPDVLQPAHELASRIRQGTLTSRELLESYLDQIGKLNERLNAVVTLDVERARKRADDLDKLAQKGKFVGALHGLPITIKDTLETAGIRTTAGAEDLSNHIPSNNAVAVQRVIDAGAVVFGKTNVPTFAADVQSFNPLFGTSVNPWNSDLTPGGSSGGAAAAVATGMTAFEIGSDIGGSIRTPAHFCGIFGLKPTHGLIPLNGHIPGPPGMKSQADIAVVGPLARSALDLDLVLGALTTPRRSRANAAGITYHLMRPKRERLSDYRVAVWMDDQSLPVDAPVREGIERAVSKLKHHGVSIHESAPPFSLASASDLYLKLLLPIFAEAGESPTPVQLLGQDSTIKDRWLSYPNLGHKQWMAANEARCQLIGEWENVFGKFDVVLCPPNPVTAVRHDHSFPIYDRMISINGKARPYLEQFLWVGATAGVAHLPAVVAPVGITESGVPTGVQIIAPRYGDKVAIHFAGLMEDCLNAYRIPGIALERY